MRKSKVYSALSIAAIASIALSGCTSGENSKSANTTLPGNDGCTSVVVATSSEKVSLMEEVGESFKNSSQAKNLDNCVTVTPIDITSGKASEILSSNPAEWENLDEAYWPTVWSPASTVWTDRVASVSGVKYYSEAKSFTETPVVFGMPESMAKALGWPKKEISIKDLEKMVKSSKGWGEVGKPLWGSFKVSKNNPNTSTTGLSTILMQAYANTGKKKDLTTKDIADSKKFSESFELGAIHYGDTTGNVLKTIYENTENGDEGSSYVSAIALEETSLINYNKGNPDSHTVQPGEELTPPSEKLVAVYPKDGSLTSDNPAVVLKTKWVKEEQQKAGEAFVEYLHSREAQEILPRYGFRPLDKSVDIRKDFTDELGVDADKPSVKLEKPSSATVSAAIDQWVEIRKPSAVLQLIDLSASMRAKVSKNSNQSRLEGAISGAQSTLGNFRKTDEIGIWGFTTGISSDIGQNIVPIRDFGELQGDRENIQSSLADLSNAKLGGTPLYDAIDKAYEYMVKRADTGRINAIVVLSDGEDSGSNISLETLLQKINPSDGETINQKPVKIFTIAYGGEADTSILERISKASGGQMFDATSGDNIDEVLTQVMNNF